MIGKVVGLGSGWDLALVESLTSRLSSGSK